MRTLACCQKKPLKAVKLNERYEKLLLNEVIGIQTLIKWIESNQFNLTSMDIAV